MIYFRYAFLPSETNDPLKVTIDKAAKCESNEPRYFGNFTIIVLV